jgi:hypothetical protein
MIIWGGERTGHNHYKTGVTGSGQAAAGRRAGAGRRKERPMALMLNNTK